MISIKESLERIGLSNNEVKVYLFLVDYGQSKAGRIAKETGIQRSSAYAAINSLTHKGLISYAKIGEVKFFQGTSPERLIEYIKEKEDLIKDLIPELTERHKASKKEGQIGLFKGIRGVKSVFKDIVREGKNNYVFGSEGQFSDVMPEFALQFDRLKNENNIHTKLIIRKGRRELDNKTTEYKYLSEIKKSSAVTNIYGNKIAIIVWTDEPEGIIIENEAAAKAYKSYFDFMWKHAK
jgi:sugar-specific transcriptional regulator TrmB